MDIFDELDTETAPKKDIFDDLGDTVPTPEQPPARVSTGALGTRFRPSKTNPFAGPIDQSAFGIGPEIVPSGANTKHPAITIPLSVAGKTAAGVAGYLTSPQGMIETSAAATPAAPAVFAKWAFDMARGGYKSVQSIVNEVGGMARDAFNKGIIDANQLGPVPEGKTMQDHIQSIAEDAANAALMTMGAVGAGGHAVGLTKGLVKGKTVPAPEVAPVKVPEETPPSGEAGEAKPSEAPVSSASNQPVAAGEVPQAMPEANPPEAKGQIGSVTPAVTEMGPGTIGETEMGAAGIKEIPETGAGAEKYGIAERVREERAKAGQVEHIDPGEGMSAQQTIDMGRDIIRRDPQAGERIMAQFEADPEKRISTAGIAVARAHGESLAAGARKIEEEFGTESPEYRQARAFLSDWDNRVKAMQTEWSKQGQAQQGETDIDTGSFTGLDRGYQQMSGGKTIPKPLKPKADKIASENRQAQESVDKVSKELNAAILEKGGNAPDPHVASIADRIRSVLDRSANDALARIKQRRAEGRLFTGIDPVELADYAVYGASKIARGALDFGAWSAEMVKDIGDYITPHLKQIWDASNKRLDEVVESTAPEKDRTRVSSAVRGESVADAEKRAIDAANKTVREAAVKLADEENKARSAQAQRDKDVANVQVKAAKKALDAAQEVERKVRERAIKEAQRRASDPSIAVWEKAKEILDENKSLYSFDDLRNKVAADLGMPVSKVTSIMAQDAKTKRLAADLWVKQRNARRLKEQAKIWLRELDTPGYQKALMSIPNAMFSLSVFGHGFVALGTHAPIVAFQPRFWNAYVRNFGKMYRMVFSPAYYEQQMQDLVRRPNYDLARQAGLQNDPFKYEEFHTTMVRDLLNNWIGEKNMERVDKLASGGNRGYGVLKLLRQDMFDQRYDNLPKSIRVQEGVKEGLADGVNHATGVTQKQGPKGSNLLLFAPRLEGSRVMWLGGDPARAVKSIANWKKTTEGERQFAVDQMKEKAWVFGTFASLLAMNQGFLAASGSKQKINGIPESLGGAGFDPLAGDFMKFKVGGANVAYGGALLTMAKLPVRVATAILYEGKGSKYILEDERVDKVLGAYVRSQMSPFAGTVSDLALGRDYEERPLPAKMFGLAEQTGKVPKRLVEQGVDEPYNWAEFAATKLPIPVAEGIKEGLRGSGMNDEQAKYWVKAWAITSIMTGTGTRITEDTREE